LCFNPWRERLIVHGDAAPTAISVAQKRDYSPANLRMKNKSWSGRLRLHQDYSWGVPVGVNNFDDLSL